jgi:hypothetical protein
MRIIDVFTLEEANAALEWHARKLAACDGGNPDAITNVGTPRWMAYLPEARRFMIGVEAWFGENHFIHKGNGKVIDDAIEIVGQA